MSYSTVDVERARRVTAAYDAKLENWIALRCRTPYPWILIAVRSTVLYGMTESVPLQIRETSRHKDAHNPATR